MVPLIRNMSHPLFQRLLSAAIGLPVLTLIVWTGSVWLAVVAALINIWGLRELHVLLRGAGYKPIPWAANLVALMILAAASLESGILVLLILGFGSSFLLISIVVYQGMKRAPGAWLATELGIIVLTLPLASGLLLRHRDLGAEWLMLGLFVVFANDTGAYVTGRLLGRTPMAPRVSPGKTWEGAIGGVAGSVGTAAVLILVLGIPFIAWRAIALGLLISVAAQIGDLAESRLKRKGGFKNSGGIIPGHGGLLDRMDSLVLTLPLIYYLATIWAIP